MKKRIISLLFVFCFIFVSCGKTDNSNSDNATTGEISISSDQEFRLIIDAQKSAFENIYKYAHLNINYSNENEIFRELLDGKVRLIIASRKLNESERKIFVDQTIIPVETKIAYDAIAVIVNLNAPDSNFASDQILSILSGKIVKWKDINPKYSEEKITVVFNNKNSGSIRYFSEKIGKTNLSNENIFAVNDDIGVINYIEKNKFSIGFIGVNWISDNDDTLSNSFLKKIIVAGISPPDTSSIKHEYYLPYQAYIAQKYYPFIREVYIISREARTGLGTGFSAFVAGEKGQRIFLKSGLVPATMPVRLVEVYNENINIQKEQ